jgi:opacity protein-like surface antigen
MKHKKLIALLAVAVLALPLAANARMWVGGYLGPNIISSTDLKFDAGAFGPKLKDVGRDISVIGGGTFGYDFVPDGFLGYPYPDWMKYFSFAIDVGYNKANIYTQTVTATVGGVSAPVKLRNMDGYNITLGFLFMAHYGFFPDSEVPQGRLHPYAGVGPAVLISEVNGRSNGLGTANATNVALITEAGLRYFALKNVSMDLAYRFRWAEQTYDFKGTGFGDIKSDTTAYIHNIIFRVAYHF